ncbi:hypothetical protein GIB67_035073 [Kingdonia uniflora]|uniref:FAR1 domain-containing protein n=1 Tax=Kingdonia uniflora TaxID=39325 RepID=A0A7J7L1U9_9MAGN|nr:hypothetical protein GIB67_035073 [Kingdonia uniflora]
MDVEVINAGVVEATDAEAGDSGEDKTFAQDDDEADEPEVGMEFESEDVARTFYDAYARRVGFSTRVSQSIRSKNNGTVISREFVCSRESIKRKNAESCNAVFKIEKKNSGNWVATKFVRDHNHSIVSPSKVHYLRPRRHFAGAAKSITETADERWTRNAKNAIGLEENNSVELEGHESLTMRYNNLCREAIKYAEEGAIATETYNVALTALKESWKKVVAVKKNVARVAPPSSSNHADANKKSPTSASETPLLWPRQEEVTRRFNLNDVGATPTPPVADLNLPHMAPVSVHRDDGPPDDMASHLPCLKSMTWVMEDKDLIPANRVAVINLKLQDHSKGPTAESEVKFHLSRVTLEPMLRSMAYIAEQLSTPTNRSAVINLKLQDTETATGESEVRFQVSRDTLGAMLRSMAYIREQLSGSAETSPLPEPSSKKKHRR